jgi:hypothetical protein
MRDASLQRLIEAIDAGLLAQVRGHETLQASRRAMAALARSTGLAVDDKPKRLEVCNQLSPAFAEATTASPAMAEAAAALAAIEPRFNWMRRPNADPSDTHFYNGHANATIIGAKGGLEERGDVWLGVTVMAPHVHYPVHDHPPEEVYLAFTAGEWWNAAMDWTEPGPGGTVYNPPGIAHTMRSGNKPFLALWLLPVE